MIEPTREDGWNGPVTASSFADLADLAAFKRAKDAGMSDARAFAYGDNGIGCWGDLTAQVKTPMCALPKDVWLEKWGSKHDARYRRVEVCHEGRSVIGHLADTMPRTDDIKARDPNGATLDLNPAFLDRFGLEAPLLKAGFWWRWVE